MNPSHGALRVQFPGQSSRFAPYPNHSRSQSLYPNVLSPQQQFLFHPPTISALHSQVNQSDIAVPHTVDLVTPLTKGSSPATLENSLTTIPTRSSAGASNGNEHADTPFGTVSAGPIEAAVSSCSCSGSCSCVLCSGSNFDKALMDASLGAESDNCQSCNDCFDCKSLLNDLPQLTPVRDAIIAAPSALWTGSAPQLGLQLQTDVQPRLDTRSPSTIKSNRYDQVAQGWSATTDPDMVSLLHNNALFASSEAEPDNSACSNCLLSEPLGNVWPVTRNSGEPAPTRAQIGEAPVAQGPSFNGPFDDTYFYAS